MESRTGFEPVSQGFAGPRLSRWTNETFNNGSPDGTRTRILLLEREDSYAI